MGAWGTGMFENDTAQDWLGEYAAEGASAVVGALMMAEEQAEEGYLEAPQASAALAACEAVAASFGRPLAAAPRELVDSLSADAPQIKAFPDLRLRCVNVVGLVGSAPETSELLALWGEVGGLDQATFEAALGDLNDRLQAGP
ncbi:MAG: hypothetical protein DI556_13850 [Rhodovulum sulfidophilum]|uniref:DUF4259 domain-containing protein n=1 Tax=Rhodovulum sulfidophilum TaxID=35806 RepID=A0A2W5QAV6_RHOSU|nr:MAG: hypothetical protein DI556_13850 [Rhodovulum sulfidophilum]